MSEISNNEVEPIRVTLLRMVKALSQIAYEAEPEFVYEKVGTGDGNSSCRYVAKGKASCIIGQALASLGVPLEQLEAIENQRASYGMDILAGRNVISLPESDDERLTLGIFVNAVQEKQDNESTWKDAFIQAATALVQ